MDGSPGRPGLAFLFIPSSAILTHSPLNSTVLLPDTHPNLTTYRQLYLQLTPQPVSLEPPRKWPDPANRVLMTSPRPAHAP